MKKFSVILVIILLFVQILPLYSFATSQDKETAPYVPSIYDVYAGELSYEEYLKLGGEPVRLEAFPTGTYYLNNKSTGRYAKNSSGSAAAQSGFLSTHGNTIQWEIAQNGNYYTIKSVSDPTKYLASGTSAGSARLLTADAGNISYCLWEMTLADGGWIIKNYQTSMYLVVYGYSLYSVNATVNPNGTNIDTFLWRGALTSIYGSTSSYMRRELDSGFTIRQFSLCRGKTMFPTVNPSPSNALWADPSDFTYSGYNVSYVTYNAQAGGFSLVPSVNTSYTMTVSATHNVTGRSTTFKLVTLPSAVLLGISATGHDHYSALVNIKSTIENCGYRYANIYYGSFSTATVDGFLDTNTNNVFVSRSHSGTVLSSSGVQIGTHIKLNDGSPSVLYSSTQSISTLDLSNMKLIMFVGCYTGAGGEHGPNLPSVAVSRGAETAVGFANGIECDIANEWTEYCLTLLEEGDSINKACRYLNGLPRFSSSGLSNYVICGNKNVKIN